MQFMDRTNPNSVHSDPLKVGDDETRRNRENEDGLNSKSSPIPRVYGHYGWNSDKMTIPKDSVYSFGVVLSWYFPLRTFKNNSQYLGHWYNHFYSSSNDVNADVIDKLPGIIMNIASWHRLWGDSNTSMMPDFLRDVYLNGPGHISRTGYLLESEQNGTGIWRQSESFSCFQIDPPHIHQYRSLAYNLIFGDVLDGEDPKQLMAQK